MILTLFILLTQSFSKGSKSPVSTVRQLCSCCHTPEDSHLGARWGQELYFPTEPAASVAGGQHAITQNTLLNNKVRHHYSVPFTGRK